MFLSSLKLDILVRCFVIFGPVNNGQALWEKRFYMRPGITAEEIVVNRGYKADVDYVATDDGYLLMLTHAKNPLINQKPSDKRPPILLTHGILESSTIFAVNSHNVKPKDFSSISLKNATYNCSSNSEGRYG